MLLYQTLCCECDLLTFEELLESCDEQLFNKTIDSTQHVLYGLLPPPSAAASSSTVSSIIIIHHQQHHNTANLDNEQTTYNYHNTVDGYVVASFITCLKVKKIYTQKL